MYNFVVAIAVGYYTSYRHLPFFSHGSSDIALADKTTFDTLIRIRPGYHKIGIPFVELMLQFNWNLVSVSILIDQKRKHDLHMWHRNPKLQFLL